MKIKLTKFYLFLILLTVLIFSSLGIKVLEGMNIIEGNESMADPGGLVDPGDLGDSETALTGDSNNDTNDVNDEGKGSKYNPFGNSDTNELSDMMDEEEITGDYDDTTFNPDVRVNFQNSNPSKSKLSYNSKHGISKDEMPPGEEHLYILKSQVVPPVCPKCPEVGGGGKGGKGCGDFCPKAPPCPRPQRCPEPAFTCKKVPNYSAANVDSVLPGGGMMGQGDKDEKNGLLNGSGAGAGNNSGAMPVLNSFASYS